MSEREAKHWLWHAVGLGMTPYARLGFALETICPAPFGFAPGTLFVSTHRADTDVPLVIASIYWRSGAWRDPSQRLHFAARDDLFERGFFAGFPAGLPLPLRRLLYPIAIERYLPMVRVHPVGSAKSMRVAQALRLAEPETPLGDVLPPGLAQELERRTGARAAREALRGEAADLLWATVTPAEAPDAAWAARTAEAKRQVERLVGVIREREPLLLFPEGRPSPDGAVGPLQRGLGLLVRRGRPERIHPLAVAYDPLTRGRDRAYVSIGRPFAPAGRDVEAQVLAALRLAMPLTAGSFAAHALATEGREPTAAGLGGAVAEAAAEGRPVERALRGPGRGERLAEALAALRERGLSDPAVLRAAREYASAREPAAATARAR